MSQWHLGFKTNDKINRVQTSWAMRCYLRINKYAPTVRIEGDMWWTTPSTRRKLEMLRFWNRVVSLEDSRLPKQIYNTMLIKGHPWISEIKMIFTSINASDIFQNNVTIINFKSFYSYTSDMMIKHYINNEWLPKLSFKPKLDLYHQHKACYKQENYCKLALKHNQRSVLAKLRLGVFPINLELGCYNGTPRDERWCPVCESKQTKNEFHILFHCPIYHCQGTDSR